MLHDFKILHDVRLLVVVVVTFRLLVVGDYAPADFNS